MMKKYENFSQPKDDFKVGDRVVCHGSIMLYNLNGYRVDTDIEGQTGIIVKIHYYRDFNQYTIFFDNLFSPNLMEYGYKNKRLYILPKKFIEKIEIDKPKHSITTFSPEIKKLLEYCEYMDCPYYLDINYIDIDTTNSYITYLPIIKIDKLKSGESPWFSKMREKLSIGRFLKKLNPYTNPVDLEKKVNIYKGMYDHIIANTSKFSIVEGDSIIEWYQESKYQKGYGTLNKSCMRNHYDKLSLYSNNKYTAMLILTDEEGKLLGRALIWNVSEPNITYMDRVYTVYVDNEERFYQYAKEQGWKTYKDDQNEEMIIKYGYDIGNGYENPYMDTFKWFILDKGKYGKYYLTSMFEEDSYYAELEETEGIDDIDDDF